MELFERNNLFGTRGSLLLLWLIVLVVSLLLIISGTKAEKKRVKIVLIILGIILGIGSLLALIFTLFFGFNY